ncbi:SfnB family sulfur acquisition oxidoreductase [Aestuariivirga sp.]|uniref:SfnB family sulfur acquisition oxidoreductase n=1 Tax=Aestuariivirga sp. TaxID=2650926 RepID=UPI003BAC3D60
MTIHSLKPQAAVTHVISSDEEAIATAQRLAAEFGQGDSERDRNRILPFAQMDALSRSGLLGITVPRAYGGADVKAGTLAEVFALISAADGSVGQIPQNHFFMIEAIREQGSDAQKAFFFPRILQGERVGNALSERNSKSAHDHETTITRAGDHYVVNGHKFYSTGVIFANWIAVVGNDETGRSLLAFVPTGTPGLVITDDWTGLGQRVTGSGSTVFTNVQVDPSAVFNFGALFETPGPMGPLAQIMHAGIQAGLARRALAQAKSFVGTSSRAWKYSGVERAANDPYTVAGIGDLEVRVAASDAVLARAGRVVEAAVSAPSEDTVAAASIAVAEAKALSTETALHVTSKLIEFAGSRGTLVQHNLDRFWRNARTHSVHDPVRWKYNAIGDYFLNGVKPPRHGAI